MADEVSKVRVGSSESEYSASERLCAMLDERGIEYDADENGVVWHSAYHPNDFAYDAAWHLNTTAKLHTIDALSETTIYGLTPEQAIDATVGTHPTTSLKMSDKESEIVARTCKNIAKLNKNGVHGYYFVCSECRLSIHSSFDIYETEYTDESLRSFFVGKKYTFERCPRCGAKVVSE